VSFGRLVFPARGAIFLRIDLKKPRGALKIALFGSNLGLRGANLARKRRLG
jgi:hypothetical protein